MCDWPWVWIFSPFWIPLITLVVILFIAILLAALIFRENMRIEATARKIAEEILDTPMKKG